MSEVLTTPAQSTPSLDAQFRQLLEDSSAPDPSPDYDEARQHIELLTGSADTPVRFRLINPVTKDVRKPALDSLENHWDAIAEANLAGFNSYFVINGGGDADADIENIRAVFVDGDGVPLPVEWHVEPDFVLARGDLNWHAYWKVSALPVAGFENTQRRLAAHYGTDRKVCNPSRVLRLAGTLHHKNGTSAGYKLISEAEDRFETLSAEEILAGLPEIEIKHVTAQQEAGSDIDLPTNIERARRRLVDLVAMGRVAVAFEGGNKRTFDVACEVIELGVSEAVALDLLADVFNPACDPPWDDADLARITANAFTYMQNAKGAFGVPSPSGTYADHPDVLKALAEPQAAVASGKGKPRTLAEMFHGYDEDEMDLMPDPEWLVPGILEKVSTALAYGLTGSYKSFLALDISVAVAAGIDTFGVRPTVKGPVFYGALEGRNNLMKARRIALRTARGIVGKIPLFVSLAAKVAQADQVEALFTEYRRLASLHGKPCLIVIDTMAKSLEGLNENDAGDAQRFIGYCDDLKDTFGCTVLVIAHPGKDSSRGTRGSSAFHSGFDTLIHVDGGTDQQKADLTTKVRVIQHKDADAPDRWFHFQGRRFAGSLVFDLVDAPRAAKGVEQTARTRVGAALRAAGAFGPGNSLGRIDLARLLAGDPRGVPDEEWQTKVLKEDGQLHNGGRDRSKAGAPLAGYFEHISWPLGFPNPKLQARWFLPIEAANAASEERGE